VGSEWAQWQLAQQFSPSQFVEPLWMDAFLSVELQKILERRSCPEFRASGLAAVDKEDFTETPAGSRIGRVSGYAALTSSSYFEHGGRVTITTWVEPEDNEPKKRHR
jgi:hypothetical protein